MVMRCQVEEFAEKKSFKATPSDGESEIIKKTRQQTKKLRSSKNSDTFYGGILSLLLLIIFSLLWTALINSIEKLPSEYWIH